LTRDPGYIWKRVIAVRRMNHAALTVPEPLYRRSRFRAPWVIFWVAFAVRVVAIVIQRSYRLPVMMDHFEYGWEIGRIARSLAQGQGFANPFNGPSGPTAWMSPLYPLLVGAGFKLFGVYTNAAAAFVLVCNSVFSAGTVLPVYEIAARCFDAKGIARREAGSASRLGYATPVALWSAWLWALYPAAMQYAVRWIWEMSLTTFLFTWTLVIALRLRRVGEPDESSTKSSTASSMAGERSQWIQWVVFGVLWGLVALSNPSLLLCLPATLVWIAWPELCRGRLGLRTIGGAALTCVAFAVVLAPWVVRNERVLHAFVPTRSNFGVELYVSTVEGNDVFPWGTAMPLWAGDPEFQEFVRMGEVPFAKMRQRDALERIRARPGVFVRHTVDRFLFFWDDTPHPLGRHPSGEYLRRLQFSFLSLCGLLGLALMLWRRVAGAGLFALCFALVPIPYYLVTVQTRFRHPIEPLIAILGVYLFRSAVPRARREELHG
jgi:hypothetical protein